MGLSTAEVTTYEEAQKIIKENVIQTGLYANEEFLTLKLPNICGSVVLKISLMEEALKTSTNADIYTNKLSKAFKQGALGLMARESFNKTSISPFYQNTINFFGSIPSEFDVCKSLSKGENTENANYSEEALKYEWDKAYETDSARCGSIAGIPFVVGKMCNGEFEEYNKNFKILAKSQEEHHDYIMRSIEADTLNQE